MTTNYKVPAKKATGKLKGRTVNTSEGLLGSGAAKKAAGEIRGRRKQIDSIISGAMKG